MHTKFVGLALEVFDETVTVLLLVGIETGIKIGGPIFKHVIEEAGDLVGGGSDGFGGTEFGGGSRG